MACTFIDNPEHKETVNHKDGNKLNNNVTNLEWATYQENVQHSYDVKLNHGRKGAESTCSCKIDMYDLNNNFVKTFDSIEEASRYLGKDGSNIHRAYNGLRKTAYGYLWKSSKNLLDN